MTKLKFKVLSTLGISCNLMSWDFLFFRRVNPSQSGRGDSAGLVLNDRVSVKVQAQIWELWDMREHIWMTSSYKMLKYWALFPVDFRRLFVRKKKESLCMRTDEFHQSLFITPLLGFQTEQPMRTQIFPLSLPTTLPCTTAPNNKITEEWQKLRLKKEIQSR